MRKFIQLSIVFAALDCQFNFLSAQPFTRATVGGHFYLKTATSTIEIDRFSYLDSLNNSYKPGYLASFDVPVSDQDEYKKFYADLQNALQKGGSLPVTITSADFNNNIVMERSYPDAIVIKAQFDNLDASAREALMLRVTLSAGSVSIKKGGGKFPISIQKSTNRGLQSNFRVNLGSLPATRVVAVSNVKLPSGNQYTDLLIKIPETDAEAWYTEFTTNSSRRSILTGSIAILTADLSKPIITLILAEAEVISYSNTGTDNIPRVTVGVRVKKLSMN